jgi:drug/metabolite transporter (DMT)-like permease
MSQGVKVHLALFLVALISGANFSVAKEVMPLYVGPFGLIVIRAVSAALFFGLLFYFQRTEKITGWSDNVRVTLCGVLGIAVNQLCLYGGLNLTSPINASLIMIIAPVVVVVLSAFLLGEKMSWHKSLGILIAAGGASLLIFYSRTGSIPGDSLGDALVLLNSVSYGAYLVMVKPLMQRYAPLTVISRVFLVGAILVIPFGYRQLLIPDWSGFPPHIWGAILFIVLGVTIIGYHLSVWALKYASPTLLGAYIYLQPVLAILIAVSFGKDIFTWQKAFFAGLIFSGVYLVSRRPRQKVEVVS